MWVCFSPLPSGVQYLNRNNLGTIITLFYKQTCSLPIATSEGCFPSTTQAGSQPWFRRSLLLIPMVCPTHFLFREQIIEVAAEKGLVVATKPVRYMCSSGSYVAITFKLSMRFFLLLFADAFLDSWREPYFSRIETSIHVEWVVFYVALKVLDKLSMRLVFLRYKFIC